MRVGVAVFRRCYFNAAAMKIDFRSMTLLPDGRWIASPQRVSKVEERLEPILVHAMPIICDCDVQDSFAKLGPDLKTMLIVLAFASNALLIVLEPVRADWRSCSQFRGTLESHRPWWNDFFKGRHSL